VVVLAVKPQVLGTVLKPLNGLFEGKLIISIIAGAEIRRLLH
jgi:pyrroline-5-carboxylate reductase